MFLLRLKYSHWIIRGPWVKHGQPRRGDLNQCFYEKPPNRPNILGIRKLIPSGKRFT